MRMQQGWGLSLGLMLLSSWALAQPRGGGGRGYHGVELAGAGAREILVETRHLKVMKLRVKAGTTLDVHAVPEALSLYALKGAGQVMLRDGPLLLDPTHMVVLAPGMEHGIRAAAGADLILLVHHVKMTGQAGTGRGGGAGRGLGRGAPPRDAP